MVVLDKDESLDGAPLDADKIGKIWSKTGILEEILSHQRLGDRSRLGNRKQSFLVTMVTKVA